MKRFIKFNSKQILRKSNVLFICMIFSIFGIYANDFQSIKGKLVDQKNNKVVPYAVVSLIKSPESVMINSVYSDTNGLFTFKDVSAGNYKLKVTVIGYKPASRNIVVNNTNAADAGIIYLEDTVIHITETVILGERLKAKSDNNKTTFFITPKILEVSSTGTDVLKLIPGIQFDINQKISLQGSPNVLIYVDGIERDRSFVSQLNPERIEKVEVIAAPPSNYDGNATGVINIILKKDRDVGLSGEINIGIPTSTSEVYLFPTYTVNYGFKKLNFYTSYNGEFIYFDVHENTYRKIYNLSDVDVISSDQYVNQRDWSHKFQFGFDYFVSSHDQINFYGFYNPYSDGRNGNADAQISGLINNHWQAQKVDMNINTGTFYSMFYKHIFEKEGSEISCDINTFKLRADNSTDYIYPNTDNRTDTLMNIVKPYEISSIVKIDFTTPVWDKLKLNLGSKAKFRDLQDHHSSNFDYYEKIFAAYADIAYTATKLDLTLGLRVEKSVSTLKNSFSNPVLTFLPNASFRYTINSREHIQVIFNSSINRPSIYQLNPYTTVSDPYTVFTGNPFLKPEIHNNLFIEHSIQFNSNFISSRLFYNTATNVINNLTFINDTNAFETQVQNSGTISHLGVQFLGSLKLGIATFNPYLRLFEVFTEGNNIAKQYDITNRHNLSYESGLSAILSFKGDIACSLVFQYATPRNNIQGNSYCSPLYFVSIDQTISQKIKIGIEGAFMFSRSVTYQGSDITGPNFYSHYAGTINLSTIPVWFKLSYQFYSGKNRVKINRSNEEPDILPKTGL